MTRQKPIHSPDARLAAVIGIFTLVAACAASSGASIGNPKPSPANPVSGGSSGIVFDRARFSQMLQTIDRGKNGDELQHLFFGRRVNEPLTRADAYKLVRAALTPEKTGSRRWFLLESLAGYAAFRTDGLDHQEGYDLYARLLPRLPDAQAVGLRGWGCIALYDFISSLSGEYGIAHQDGPEDSRWQVPLALQEQIALIRSGQPTINRIDWAGVETDSGSERACAKIAQAALDEPDLPRSFALLVTTGEVLATTSPRRSLNLLRQAAPFIHEASAPDAAYYYGGLSAALERAGDWSGAIGAQEGLVRLSGRGTAARVALPSNQGHSSLQHSSRGPGVSIGQRGRDRSDAGDSDAWDGLRQSETRRAPGRHRAALELSVSPTNPYAATRVERTALPRATLRAPRGQGCRQSCAGFCDAASDPVRG